MKSKITERNRAVKMRRGGETMSAIADALSVSKASVSLWTKGIQLPKAAQRIIAARKVAAQNKGNETKRRLTQNALERAKAESGALVSKTFITPELALIICAMMYWCEGTKSIRDKEFTFSNSDPLLVQGFLALLRKSLPLDESKFRIKMHLHEYHDEAVEKAFWATTTGIPERQFQNTYWKSHTSKAIREGYRGCAHIRYHDVTVSRRIYAIARAFLANMVN